MSSLKDFLEQSKWKGWRYDNPADGDGYGGDNNPPTNTIDCSNFIDQVLSDMGYDMPYMWTGDIDMGVKGEAVNDKLFRRAV